MARLVLIRHAPPDITPEVPSPRWVLSAQGRERCGWLADQLDTLGVARLYSSLEPKALETAALVGMRLGLEVRPRPDLHENDRTSLAFGSADGLKHTIRRFFEAPFERVMGRETARDALTRFKTAVRALVAEAPDETVAVVAHGVVITLLAASRNAIDPFDFWDALSSPCCVVLDAASLALDGPPRLFDPEWVPRQSTMRSDGRV
jgi:broad specificity phosphatase PhoE